MGYELHIVATRDWTQASSHPLASDTWQKVVDDDSELRFSADDYVQIRSSDGSVSKHYAVLWQSAGSGAVFWFADGEVTAKSPDDATIRKMLVLAERLSAYLVGDDGEVYRTTGGEPGWRIEEADLGAQPAPTPKSPTGFFGRLFRRSGPA